MPVQLNFFDRATYTKDFAAGETIFKEGDEGDVMYGVKEGEVEIVYRGTQLNVVTKSGVFGEMALISKEPRSADAVAKTDCKLVPIDPNLFLFMVHETPNFSLFVMETLVNRLHAMQKFVRID